jgi:hypothetical protein
MSATSVKIILSGGPVELSAAELAIPSAELGRTLKIGYQSGYEHFVHDGECRLVDGAEVPVFRWSCRTKIAE